MQGSSMTLGDWSLLLVLLYCQPGSNPVSGDDYIIGGIDAADNQIPWQVYLAVTFPDEVGTGSHHDCGGTIVNQQQIMTAAHCLLNDGRSADASGIKVYVGSNVMATGRLYAVVDRVYHEQFNVDGATESNDIALLTLNQSISVGPNVQVACLPSKSALAYAKSVTVSGWGVKDGAASKQLQVLTGIQILKTCGSKLPGEFCAGGQKNKDTCSGDSGGPAVLFEENCPVLVGITSHGTDGSCGVEGNPGYYTDVYHYIKNNWLCENGLQHKICETAFYDNRGVEYTDEQREEPEDEPEGEPETELEWDPEDEPEED